MCKVGLYPLQFADIVPGGVKQQSVAVVDACNDDAASKGVGHVGCQSTTNVLRGRMAKMVLIREWPYYSCVNVCVLSPQ